MPDSALQGGGLPGVALKYQFHWETEMKRSIALLAGLMFAGTAHAGDVTVTGHGAEPVGGMIAQLFTEDGYVDTPVAELYTEMSADGTATLTFSGVAPGTYAIVVIHDENGNGEMDTNFLGIPREPGGFSNNAPARMGPARFSEAAFEVGDDAVTLDISFGRAE